MYLDAEDIIKSYIGRTIGHVDLNEARDVVTITFLDGEHTSLVLRVGGGCCSQSWIEHLETPSDLYGAVFLDFMETQVNAAADPLVNPPDEWGFKSRCVMVYSSRFITDRGEIVLEYRNSSNGYYGGYLTIEDGADTSKVKGICISLGCDNEASSSRPIGQITVPVCSFHENNTLVIDDAIVPKAVKR